MFRSTRRGAIIATLATVQFVNILDFMIVMPLGPDLAGALGIPLPMLGVIGGSYTAAAAIAGLAGAFFMDRFDRRTALLVATAGLATGTLVCATATGLHTLVAARILAGMFGGPATSLTIAIVADIVPEKERGRAMGVLMSAFSVASVIGVPAGLELARIGGWRLPFISVGLLGLAAWILAFMTLPTLRDHLGGAEDRGASREIVAILSRRIVLTSLAMTTTAMMGGFILIPHLATFFMENQGLPRERLGLLYLIGGAFSFFSMRMAGSAIDRVGAARVGSLASVVLLAVIYSGFYTGSVHAPLLVTFVAFMLSTSTRNVAYNTLTSRVPLPFERARYMSIRSSVQHLAAAAGAFLSSRMLIEAPDGSLVGMPSVALVSMGLAALLPMFFLLVERSLSLRGRSAPPAPEATDISCEVGT